MRDRYRPAHARTRPRSTETLGVSRMGVPWLTIARWLWGTIFVVCGFGAGWVLLSYVWNWVIGGPI